MLCFVSFAHAQDKHKTTDPNNRHKKWKRGFVVTTKGDTITGRIKNEIIPPFYDMQAEFSFDNENGVTKHYIPDSLRSFTYYDEQPAKIDTATYVGVNLDDPTIGHAFFRLYLDAPCRIYGYKTLVATGMSSTRLVEYKYIRIGKGSFYPISRLGFKKNMKELFSGCPKIIDKIESETITIDNWEWMAQDYNHDICK